LTTTYDSFIAQTVAPEEDNNMYIRGCASNPSEAAYGTFILSNVTNELILWPQVLKGATQIGASGISLSYDPNSVDTSDNTPAGGECDTHFEKMMAFEEVRSCLQ
jgi:hypothetical protein